MSKERPCLAVVPLQLRLYRRLAAGIQAFGHIAGGIAFDIQQGESQRPLLGCRLADTVDRTGDIVAASLRDLPRIPQLHGGLAAQGDDGAL